MDKKFYVYGLVDPRNNEIKYIGKGSRHRMFDHVRNAINDNISDNNYIKFKALKEILTDYEDIAYCKLFESDNESEAYKVEKKLTIEYNTLNPNGWNIVLGHGAMSGELNPNFGRKHSEQARQNMSFAHRGRQHTQEQILKRIESRKGYTHSEETRIKMSEKAKGRTISDETRLKMSESHKGLIMPEEVKKKISQGNKGKIRTNEAKEKYSKAKLGNTVNLGRTCSEETKRKIGLANRKKPNDKVDKEIIQEKY